MRESTDPFPDRDTRRGLLVDLSIRFRLGVGVDDNLNRDAWLRRGVDSRTALRFGVALEVEEAVRVFGGVGVRAAGEVKGEELVGCVITTRRALPDVAVCGAVGRRGGLRGRE